MFSNPFCLTHLPHRTTTASGARRRVSHCERQRRRQGALLAVSARLVRAGTGSLCLLLFFLVRLFIIVIVIVIVVVVVLIIVIVLIDRRCAAATARASDARCATRTVASLLWPGQGNACTHTHAYIRTHTHAHMLGQRLKDGCDNHRESNKTIHFGSSICRYFFPCSSCQFPYSSPYC